MEKIDNKTTALEFAYELDYEIEDPVFAEPFIVKKPVNVGRPNWWRKKDKVEALIKSFKMDMQTQEALVASGITYDQYRNFVWVHPDFVQIKNRCKRYAAIVAKQGLIKDLQNPKEARTRQWYLERKQPHLYGRDIGAYTSPPPEAAKRISGEAFLDKYGKIIVSNQTAEILKQEYGEESNPEDTGEIG